MELAFGEMITGSKLGGSAIVGRRASATGYSAQFTTRPKLHGFGRAALAVLVPSAPLSLSESPG